MTIALFIGRSAEDNREFAELQSKEQLSMKQSPGDSSGSKASRAGAPVLLGGSSDWSASSWLYTICENGSGA